MEKDLNRLILALNGLVQAYEDVLEAVEVKRRAMVAVDIPAVQAAVKREEALLDRIKVIHDARLRIFERLSQHPKIRFRECTIKELVVQLPPEEERRSEIAALRKRLQELTQEIAQKNQVNTLLCKQSLEQVDSFIGVLTGVGLAPITYSPKGNSNPRSPRALLDRQA